MPGEGTEFSKPQGHGLGEGILQPIDCQGFCHGDSDGAGSLCDFPRGYGSGEDTPGEGTDHCDGFGRGLNEYEHTVYAEDDLCEDDLAQDNWWGY